LPQQSKEKKSEDGR